MPEQAAIPIMSPEEFLDLLHEEMAKFEKPRCKSSELALAKTNDVLADIHRALYGNGGTCGLIWKTAEHGLLLKAVAAKHATCRAEVVKHFDQHLAEDIAKDRGVVAFVKRHKAFTLVIGVLLFFGATSLFSLLLEERQATKVESIVLDVLRNKVGMKTP